MIEEPLLDFGTFASPQFQSFVLKKLALVFRIHFGLN